ncbi:hypothetical protein PISMIDRAFT_17135 [Pisolithus microcarpus 441]|uniref:Uncharacterized protein n=1 Tax=Pisolithus microcarpus 441 TaxID=765257 RepID=A0A0C9YWV6_9AGAM|nr:hypothetical protein BKA83DRAFT_17135 [Pisolithus microcarpus]KIK14662.1 hypothetical protein PISMIDRAFT_17135 [Pisolithus microcarpus 441]
MSFLIQNNHLKVAKDFVYATLKDDGRSDIYSLHMPASLNHGLAIATTEDALEAFSSVTVALIAEETHLQIKNARDALDVFAKIRESLGHAIESSWYAKASKDQLFPATNTAFKYAQRRFAFNQATKHNTTMIQQKATKLLFGLSPSKRSN